MMRDSTGLKIEQIYLVSWSTHWCETYSLTLCKSGKKTLLTVIILCEQLVLVLNNRYFLKGITDIGLDLPKGHLYKIHEKQLLTLEKSGKTDLLQCKWTGSILHDPYFAKY